MFNRLKGHFQEYISRYAVLALAILTPLAGLLGSVAADLGGADTKAGHAVLAAASALGVAAAGVVFIRNLGIWQMLDQFGTAPGVHPVAPAMPTPPPEGAVRSGAMSDEDMGAEAEAALPVSPDVDRRAHAHPDPELPPEVQP